VQTPALGTRTVSVLGRSGRTEATALQATVITDDETTTKRTAEGPQPPGLSTFTDVSRTDSGAVGAAVT